MKDMTYSAEGLSLTKTFEGLELAAFKSLDGVWTIGYGHTSRAVWEGMTITQAQAELLLESDIARAVDVVNRAVDVEISQGQFDALVDLVFDMGAHAFWHSMLLALVNRRHFASAAAEFTKCNGFLVGGLERRRVAELALFVREDA